MKDGEALRGTDMETVATEGGLQIVNAAGKKAEGVPQSGYPDMDIPSCMGTLPSDAAALAATAIDPFGWEDTQRRNEHDDWQLACNSTEVNQTVKTVGSVRYSQTRPVELHPWRRHPAGTTRKGDGTVGTCTVGTDSGCRDISDTLTDMARWEAACDDRKDGKFDYAGRTDVPIPPHGQCDPKDGPGYSDTKGKHFAEAAVFKVAEACREPAEITGTRARKWHFYDTLCKEARTAAGRKTAMAGTTDSSVRSGFVVRPSSFLDENDYDGTPQPQAPERTPPESKIPACVLNKYCPVLYNDTPTGGTRLRMRKHRLVWVQDKAGRTQNTSGTWGHEITVGSTTFSKWRNYCEDPSPVSQCPSATQGTQLGSEPGVFTGDPYIADNFSACTKTHIVTGEYQKECPPCPASAPDVVGRTFVAGTPLKLRYRWFHPHSSQYSATLPSSSPTIVPDPDGMSVNAPWVTLVQTRQSATGSCGTCEGDWTQQSCDYDVEEPVDPKDPSKGTNTVTYTDGTQWVLPDGSGAASCTPPGNPPPRPAKEGRKARCDSQEVHPAFRRRQPRRRRRRLRLRRDLRKRRRG